MKFFRGIKKEVQRTRWLGFEELKVVFKLVLIFITLVGLYFLFVDFLITLFLDWLEVAL